MLSNSDALVSFGTQREMARAIGTLIGCHGHHFAVIPDAGMGWAIVCSEMAARCLQDRLAEPIHVPTARPMTASDKGVWSPVAPPPLPPADAPGPPPAF
jgi:hypothetical protein